MNKNIATALAIIVVLLGGYFLLNKKETSAPTVDEITAEESEVANDTPATQSKPTTGGVSKPANQTASATVEYTDDGYVPAFSPSITVIYKGQSVLFVNKSKSKMWVASGPHPMHTAYPGFDSKVGIAPGGTYLFTFNTVGDWKYHNHLDSLRTGTIVVKYP